MSFERINQPTSASVTTTISQTCQEKTECNGPTLSIAYNEEKELDQARHAVARLSIDHPDWLHRSRDFASLLLKRFGDTKNDMLLTECIEIQRQICAVCTTGHPDRAASACDLALSLQTYFNQTGEESLLAEAIALNRETLSLRPIGHPDRSRSCNNLAYVLWMCFNRTGDESLLVEAIDLHRTALSLRHSGHPDRSTSCNNLAIALWTRFHQTGDESLLTEAIDLHREALSLRPCGHPDRSQSCSNLAILLFTRFGETGEDSLVTEGILLSREALTLRPCGHPDRYKSCSNLANSLWARFNQIGEDSLLTEAIELNREALSLQPREHPVRWTACNNLANSLLARFKQTGEESLLTEAIEHQREALSLRPSGHPDRGISCNNLGNSLCALFNATGEKALLTDAIELHREALSLRPRDHPLRYMSCSNLAVSLYALFKQAGGESSLSEAIILHREALSLQTSGHPDRLETCSRLVASLRTHFKLTGDESLLHEAIYLINDIMETHTQRHPRVWHAIINLVHIYLDRRFSHHNVGLAINYIQRALSLISDDWPTLLYEVAHLTSLIDLPTLSQDSLSQLLQCFSDTIDLASRVAGFVLDPQSQLRYLTCSRYLGPRAYWCALACQQPQLGLELMERARAVIWTQALHMRNPQLAGAPPEFAPELIVLLSQINTLRVAEDPMSLSSHDRDVQYRISDRIHQLIQQIRAIPGQERFMRGLSSKEIAQCASRNAVVLLVATEGECHALILQPKNEELITLELPDISPNELTTMSIVTSVAQMRAASPDDDHSCRMGMKAKVFESSSTLCSHRVLERLWTAVVKSVIAGLGLQVRVISVNSSTMLQNIDIQIEIFGIIAASPSLVPDWSIHVSSTACCRYLYSQQRGMLHRLCCQLLYADSYGSSTSPQLQ
jgi:hypothetical protein